MFLQVKVRTADPEEVLARVRKAGLLPPHRKYLSGEGLLVLGYPAENPDETLRGLSRVFSFEEVEETGLSETPLPAPERFSVGPLRFFVPVEAEAPAPGEIYLRSTLSFGSGRHPTTKLCLRLLTELFPEVAPEAVFDLGCGSGILALAAAGLGAQRVLAADIDPRAVREARHNVERNGLSGRILIIRGSLDSAALVRFDLVLANLTIGTLSALLPEIPGVLRPGGVAIVSGISSGQREEILSVVPRAEVLREVTEEGWLALALRF